MKACSKCKLTKPKEDFGKRASNEDGLDYRCKDCNKIYAREYRATRRAKANQSAIASRNRLHWTVRLQRGSKSSANTRKLEHSISVEDIQSIWESQNGKCYWLGIALDESNGLPDRHPLKPSLDRLDNSRGYVRENVVITSTFANLGRSNTTVEDFSEFLNVLKQELLK